MPTGEIDTRLTKHCGELKIPQLDVVQIRRISDIPLRIKEIRSSRCGPKLEFGNKSVTMEFRSGFYADKGRYAEQLYILFGKDNTHKRIADLFDHLDLKKFKRDERIEKIGIELKVYDDFVQENVKVFNQILEWVESSGADMRTNLKKAQEIANGVVKEQAKALHGLHALVQGDIRSLIDSKDHLKLEEEVLKERLIGVWFIAETFRYPPMLFYSLILIHLFINQVIDTNKIRELHPAYEKGSQRTLVFSFSQESSCELNVEKFDQAEEKKLNQKKIEILKLLFEDVNKHLKSTYFAGDYSKVIFKSYCVHYLELCGITADASVDKSLDDLVESFRKPTNSWARA